VIVPKMWWEKSAIKEQKRHLNRFFERRKEIFICKKQRWINAAFYASGGAFAFQKRQTIARPNDQSELRFTGRKHRAREPLVHLHRILGIPQPPID